MGVDAVHREGEFVGVGLANEAGAVVEQALHGGRGAGLDARQRQHMRIAAASGIAGNIEEILHGEAETVERAAGRMRHLDCGIGNEGVGGVLIDQHGVSVGAGSGLEPLRRFR